MLMCYVVTNEDILNSLLSENFQRIYRSQYYKMSNQNFRVLSFSLKRHLLYHISKNIHCHISGKAKITDIDKGKNIQMELTGEELQRKIEQITREIKEAKEEGLRVDMAITIYKDATVTLDEDLASQMKIKKDVEMNIDDLRDKLDILWLKVQEREARIDSDTAALLVKIVLLDKELTVRTNLTGGKYPAYEQRVSNSCPDNARHEVIKEYDCEEIINKPPFLGRLKGRK